jgi:hypothetical protein
VLISQLACFRHSFKKCIHDRVRKLLSLDAARFDLSVVTFPAATRLIIEIKASLILGNRAAFTRSLIEWYFPTVPGVRSFAHLKQPAIRTPRKAIAIQANKPQAGPNALPPANMLALI